MRCHLGWAMTTVTLPSESPDSENLTLVRSWLRRWFQARQDGSVVNAGHTFQRTQVKSPSTYIDYRLTTI